MSRRQSSGMQIRAARLADLDALVELENSSFSTDHLSRRQFRYHLQKPDGRVRVVARDGEILAYLLLLRRGTTGRIYSIAVSAKAQGQGLGRALCTDAERVARDQGLERLRLEVRVDNQPALRLYQSLGYREIAKLPRYYADGQDGLRWEKSLR